MHNQHKLYRVFRLINLLRSRPSKSIAHLAELLDTSERTIYRYLDMLTEVGFQIERTAIGKVQMDGGELGQAFSFTADESLFLQRLVWTTGRDHMLRYSVLEKIYIKSEQAHLTDIILNANRSRNYEQMDSAIKSKSQAILKQYYSISSQTIRDRRIEPYEFGTDRLTVHAYDLDDNQNKIFHLDRMTSVEVSKTPWRKRKKHRPLRVDCFGFHFQNWSETIEIQMNLKAKLLLEAEFPHAKPHIHDLDKGDYLLKCEIYDSIAPSRFFLGLWDDLILKKGESVNETIRDQLSRRLEGLRFMQH